MVETLERHASSATELLAKPAMSKAMLTKVLPVKALSLYKDGTCATPFCSRVRSGGPGEGNQPYRICLGSSSSTFLPLPFASWFGQARDSVSRPLRRQACPPSSGSSCQAKRSEQGLRVTVGGALSVRCGQHPERQGSKRRSFPVYVSPRTNQQIDPLYLREVSLILSGMASYIPYCNHVVGFYPMSQT